MNVGNMLASIEHVQHIRSCGICYVYSILFNPHNYLTRWAPEPCECLTRGNWGYIIIAQGLMLTKK